MNQEIKKVKELIEREARIRKISKEKEQNNERFSYLNFFAGDEFNQELNRIKIEETTSFKINLIDFDQLGKESKESIEGKIKKVCDDNKSLIEEEKKLPIIWFKNIDRASISIQDFLLSIFDPGQNSEEELNNYHLIATISTHDMSKLPETLVSRLNCINVKTAQPKKSFFDKYFNFLLGGTALFITTLLIYLFWPHKSKEIEE